MPGYPLSAVDKQTISSKYFCSVCKDALRDPLQTTCGHFYCRSCAQTITEPNGSMICVQDDTKLTLEEIFNDNFMKREVLSLQVNCPNDQEYCVWIGTIQELESHNTVCVFFRLPCPNRRCCEVIQRMNLPKHVETCTYGRAVSDPNKQTKIPLPSHGRGNQGHVVADSTRDLQSTARCIFDAIGCHVQSNLASAQLEEHMKVCSEHHVQLLLAYLLKLESCIKINIAPQQGNAGTDQRALRLLQERIDEVVKISRYSESQLAKNSERLSHLEGNYTNEPSGRGSTRGLDVGEITRRVTNTEHTTADLGLLMGEVNVTLDELQRKISDLDKRHTTDQQTIRQLEARLNAQDHATGMRSLTVSDLENRIDSHSLMTHDGVMVWRITEVARKRNDAVGDRQRSFYSQPFYSDRYGYKCCARIYLNGDGIGRGTHISLFFVLMRGEYDAILRWPFRQKVTLMLLDQDNMNHVIDAFRPDPNSSSFQRPTRDMNIASGCPLFCALSDLNKCAYVRDDTMFLKIIVDKPDMQ